MYLCTLCDSSKLLCGNWFKSCKQSTHCLKNLPHISKDSQWILGSVSVYIKIEITISVSEAKRKVIYITIWPNSYHIAMMLRERKRNKEVQNTLNKSVNFCTLQKHSTFDQYFKSFESFPLLDAYSPYTSRFPSTLERYIQNILNKSKIGNNVVWQKLVGSQSRFEESRLDLNALLLFQYSAKRDD